MQRLLFFIFFVICSISIYPQYKFLCRDNILTNEKDIIAKVSLLSLPQLYNTISINNNDSLVMLHTPPIGDQGRYNACYAWSLGYACASIACYEEKQDWDVAKRSPSFIFNYKKCYKEGELMLFTSDVRKTLYLEGICSDRFMPHSTSIDILPNSIHFYEASLTKFEPKIIDTPTNVEDYKAILRSGYAISVLCRADKSFHSMWNNPDSCVWDTFIPSLNDDSIHATTIVGYDDYKQQFKVMNSWGVSNAEHGFYWVTYDNVRRGCYFEPFVLEKKDSLRFIDIVGSSEMCDSTYYYVSNLPDSASLSWGHLSIGSGSPISHVVVDDTTAIYNRSLDLRDDVISSPLAILPPIEPRTYVTATISMDTSAVTLQKRVKLPYNAAPRISCSETTLSVNKRVTFTEERFSSEADSSIVWNIIFRPAFGTEQSTTAYGHHIQYTPPKIGQLFVTARRLIGCPENDSKTVSYFVLARKLQIVSVSAECLNFESLSDEKYDIFIYDLQGNMLASTHAYGEIFSIPCGVFSNRPFMVVAIQNGEEVLRQKIPSVH